MILPKLLSKKKFAIYGHGTTGSSVIHYFKKNNFKDFFIWDDNKKIRNNFKKKINLKEFSKKLKEVDFIILSPGINIKKAKFRKQLMKNKHKIITDLDLFFMSGVKNKTIVVTGSNGKSTTCKIIEHMLRKSNIDSQLGGNIGTPVLSLRKRKKSIFVIEASSYQLAYSKFVKPTYAIILNISNDHLDWHGSMNNYVNSKMKIFSLQDKKGFALLNDNKLIKKLKKKGFSSKLKLVSIKPYKKIQRSIENSLLNSGANEKNMCFVYALSKILRIKDSLFIKSLKSFKGLHHRHEIFYKKRNVKFINDSKATSFEASKFALMNNENIFWIVGGLPKMKDKFYFKNIKKNIIKAYIVGKNVNFFKNELKKNVNFEISKTLKRALIQIFKKIKKLNYNKKITVLLSPASASFDQYRNFEERGNNFKKLVKLYANKSL